jgi:predicted methyltransferase
MYNRLLAVLLTVNCLPAASFGIDAAIPAAIADSHRPPEQVLLDDRRKPAQLLAFAGLKQGDVVADFMPGNAYFTRIVSKVVGPKGRVYGFIPQEEIDNCPPREVAGSRAIEHDPAYRNVTILTGPVNSFAPSRQLDVLWTAQNYHDLHDSFLGPANIKSLNKAFFDSLKPGGVFIVIDHVATAGSGLRDTDTLHRIDPSTVREEIEAAGFVFEGSIDDLKNAGDDHTRIVFDPMVRGQTDQFVFKFRKPKSSISTHACRC